MSTAKEREAIREPSNAVMKFACRGDRGAYAYLQGVGNVARVLDDLVDQDFPVPTERLLTAFRWLLVDCHFNPFYQKHATVLVNYHGSALSAWEESIRLDQGNETQRIYAHVLRDWCLSLVSAVALLTGGYQHMRSTEQKVWQLYAKPLGG